MEFLNKPLYETPPVKDAEEIGYQKIETINSEVETNVVSFTDTWADASSSNITNDPPSSSDMIAIKEETLDIFDEIGGNQMEAHSSMSDASKQSFMEVQSQTTQSSKDESDIFAEFVASQLKKIKSREVLQDAVLEIHQILHRALKRR